MHPSSAVIHCQPSMLEFAKENNMHWGYSKRFGKDEIDLIVDDIPYECVDGTYQDPDEQLCEHYGIDYDQVNCIEALY